MQLKLLEPDDVVDEAAGQVPLQQKVQLRLATLEALRNQMLGGAKPFTICGRRSVATHTALTLPAPAMPGGIAAAHQSAKLDSHPCFASFDYLLHKIEHQANEAKLMLVAIGTDVEIKPPRRTNSPDAAAAAAALSSRIAPTPHWSSVGGTAFRHGWQTAEEARALLANFASLAPAKMAAWAEPRLRCPSSPS